jgi:erythromycin esterase-like protein
MFPQKARRALQRNLNCNILTGMLLPNRVFFCRGAGGILVGILSVTALMPPFKASAQFPASPDAAPESVVNWIRERAIPLKTVDAGKGFADMEPLRATVGDARLVELGEATHGTREFFQLKHRMLEFLATEMGFSIFSIEANMPEAYRLNEYVLTGKGNPAALLKGMYFWTWDTEEVLGMISWMREFNASGKGRLQFTGFDMQTTQIAGPLVAEFAKANDADLAETIDSAVRDARLAENVPQNGANFGVLTAAFPVTQARGKRIRYSGAVKTAGIKDGYAGLWWRVDGAPGEVLAFDNMQSRGIRGDRDWEYYTIELAVPEKATNINFGLLHPGDGTAWFDDLKIEVDEKPFTEWSFDPTFEKAPAVATGGNGYQVGLDAGEKQQGERSLRMRFVSAPPAPAVKPSDVAKTWTGILRHLNENRAGYKAKGRTDGEIDWVIQNARVVEQAMRMRTGEVARDTSMARNIQWILDQNPEAKMVVWAHNGHVADSTLGSMPSMGAELRKALGTQMVIIGFSFDQGSFQSTEAGKGLREFTVPPAPTGSLDATLTGAGIPVFALDLRSLNTAPAAVRQWWRLPHQTRSIGALYSDAAASQYFANQVAPDIYDALLFVEKTTQARKNPGLAR